MTNFEKKKFIVMLYLIKLSLGIKKIKKKLERKKKKE
jgi:hypothetical protein